VTRLAISLLAIAVTVLTIVILERWGEPPRMLVDAACALPNPCATVNCNRTLWRMA